ncbi:MAG: HK97 gp10 family phage protein [Nitrospirae bacterium]|nr:HK97 gp10 family phage protein [Nitrospirota bacterium]
MNITVQVEGKEQVIANVKRLTETVVRKVKTAMRTAALDVQRDAKRRVAVDTGNLRASIKANISPDGLKAEIGVDKQANANYAPYIEYGTRPHWPPLSALTEWCRRHRMQGKEFLIARKIARYGTKPRPFLIPAWESVKPGFIKAMQDAVKADGY